MAQNQFRIVTGFKYKIWRIFTIAFLISRGIFVAFGMEELTNSSLTSKNNLLRCLRWTFLYYTAVLSVNILLFTEEILVLINFICYVNSIKFFGVIPKRMILKNIYPALICGVGLGYVNFVGGTLASFILCQYHYLEDIFQECKNTGYWTNVPFPKFILQTVSNLFFEAHMFSSILPVVLIMIELPLCMKIILEEIRKYEDHQNYNSSNLGSYNENWMLRYKTILVIFRFWDEYLRNVIFPACINFTITNATVLLVTLILLGRKLHPIVLITFIGYGIVLIIAIYAVIKNLSELTELSKQLQHQHIMKLSIFKATKKIQFVKQLKPAKLHIGDFHVVDLPILCMMGQAVTDYTVSLLLAAK